MHTQTGSETRKETPYVARERIINMSCFSENPFLSQQALVLPGVPREDLNLAIRLFTHHRPVLPLTFASCRALGLDVAFFRRANSAQLSSHCRSSLLCLCCYAEHCWLDSACSATLADSEFLLLFLPLVLVVLVVLVDSPVSVCAVCFCFLMMQTSLNAKLCRGPFVRA